MDGQPNDTAPETEKFSVAELRAMSPEQKIRILCEMIEKEREQVMASVRERFPSASHDELRWRFAEAWLGPELAAKVREYERSRRDSH